MLKKIKMRESIGSSEGWAYGYGQIAEIDTDLADKWIAAGVAVPVIVEEQIGEQIREQAEEQVAPETAAMAPPETAAMPAPQRKSKR